jgi:hypothetical protein
VCVQYIFSTLSGHLALLAALRNTEGYPYPAMQELRIHVIEAPPSIAPPPYVARLEHLSIGISSAAASLASMAALSSLTSLVLFNDSRPQPSADALAALLDILGARLVCLEDLTLCFNVRSDEDAHAVPAAAGQVKGKGKEQQDGGRSTAPFPALSRLDVEVCTSFDQCLSFAELVGPVGLPARVASMPVLRELQLSAPSQEQCNVLQGSAAPGVLVICNVVRD